MGWLVLWIGFAVVTAIAASSRGRSGGGWFLLGMLFGVFALIAVLVMPKLSVEPVDTAVPLPGETKKRTELRLAKEAERARTAAETDDTMNCPRCAETIKKAATMCRFCQLDLEAWRSGQAPTT